jgi:putative transposase
MPSKIDLQKPFDQAQDRRHRKSIRLKGYDYSQAGAYFVTVVCQNRAPLFGEIIDGEMVLNDAGKMVVTEWEAIVGRFPNVELGIYVVMPNHFHAIVMIRDATSVGAGLVPAPVTSEENIPFNGMNPGEDRAAIKAAPTGNLPTLGQILGAFKSITTHAYIHGVDEKGWPQFDKRLWQRNYYERIIRNDREMDAIWRYIEANPATWATDEENPQPARKVTNVR